MMRLVEGRRSVAVDAEQAIRRMLRQTQRSLQTLRRDLIGRLLTFVRMDPLVQDIGQAGSGRFEVSHLPQIRALANLAIDRWADRWGAMLRSAHEDQARRGIEAVDRRVAQAARLVLREAVTADEAAVLRTLGIDPATLAPEVARELADLFLVDLVTGLSDAMKADIGRRIRTAILTQQAPIRLMQSLGDVLIGAGAPSAGPLRGFTTSTVLTRAEVIVRTEMGRVFSAASEARMHQAAAAAGRLGLALRKKWVSVLDGRERPAHRSAHVETAQSPIPIDQPFVVDGERLRFPLDPAGSPGNTIQCRCHVETVLA
jgi:hypothetical protein